MPRYTDWQDFERSLKSKPGVQVLMCPKCNKVVSQHPVRITGLNDYAFKWGRDSEGKPGYVNWDFDGRGCCFPPFPK